jgi:transketolase
MNAAKNKLDNMVAIVDRNGVQLAGRTKDIMDFDIAGAWRAFGWEVMVIDDGNDVATIIEAIKMMKNSNSGKPHVIIANTVKGKGISFMEDNLNWHARGMEKEQYDEAVSYLESLEQEGEK